MVEPHTQLAKLPPVRAVEAPLLGLIDVGGAFLCEALRRPGGSRLVALWDQAEGPAAAPWCQAPGRGRWLSAEALDALALATQCPDDEIRHYRALGFPPLRAIDHATQMFELLAADRGADAASRAPLALVALPARIAGERSDRPPWEGILNGLRFLLGCSKAQVLVTIAVGCSWGPRQGRSNFEHALDQLLLEEPRLMVVWAGGSAERMAPAGWEAELPPRARLHLDWLPEGAPDRDEHLGLWWQAERAPRWRVLPPFGEPGPWLEGPAAQTWQAACRAAHRPKQSEAELTLSGSDPALWRLEIEAETPTRLQTWLMRAPLNGFLRGDHGARPQVTLWNGLAGSSRAGVAMAPGSDVPPGALVWPVPPNGLPTTALLSGSQSLCGGSSAAAALASRALFNRLMLDPSQGVGPGQWQALWRALAAASARADSALR